MTISIENMQKVEIFLNTFTKLDTSLMKEVSAHLNYKPITKGDFFIKKGDSSSSVAFVVKGLFKMYYITHEGKEFIKEFIPENAMLGAYAATLKNMASHVFIEAMEDSQIIPFDIKILSKKFEENLQFQKLKSKITEMIFLKREIREYHLLCLTASERYQEFLKEFPLLKERVPQYAIASFLGISPITLSRIVKSKN